MWKMIKSLGISIVLTAILVLARLAIPLTFDEIALNTLGIFTQVLGTLYGIMAAFIVYVVWKKYNRIVEVSEKETDALSELHALTTYLEDDELSKNMKKLISVYSRMVIDRGWKKLACGQKSNKANDALHDIYLLIKSIKSERKRFGVIFGQIISKYEWAGHRFISGAF